MGEREDVALSQLPAQQSREGVGWEDGRDVLIRRSGRGVGRRRCEGWGGGQGHQGQADYEQEGS